MRSDWGCAASPLAEISRRQRETSGQAARVTRRVVRFTSVIRKRSTFYARTENRV
jgi:hypothetical protein